MSETQHLLQAYDQNVAYESIERHYKTDGELPVEFIRMHQPEIEASFEERGDIAVVLAWDAKGETVVDFGEGKKHLNQKGGFYVNPIGGDYWFRQTQSAELLIVSADLASLANSLAVTKEALTQATRPLHDRLVVDPLLADWTKRLWLSAEREGAFASLAVDHGLVTLVCALLDRAIGGSRSGDDVVPLSSAELNKCYDFIEDRLETPLRLHDLSNAIGCAQVHLAAAFKTATGQTPHQYVLSRRIARAQELLAAGEMPLAEIAYTCGFASQSHMTDVFREKLGVTPGRYRKEVRS